MTAREIAEHPDCDARPQRVTSAAQPACWPPTPNALAALLAALSASCSHPPLSAGAEARAASLHDRLAHLAFLVEAAPEHDARASWLQELADNGPAWQRVWARAQR